MKLHILVSVLTLISLSQTIYPCPCNASKEDPRPFFEQYDEKQSTTNENNYTDQEIRSTDESNYPNNYDKNQKKVSSNDNNYSTHEVTSTNDTNYPNRG